ncbi:MAG: hypothetical protein ACYC4K_02825 [Thiobacillus sp.]
MPIETFNTAKYYLGDNFVLGISTLGYDITNALQTIAPSYLYAEYSDDSDLQAFVSSYNAIAQGYLDWFNNTPLGVYSSPAITGPLLDWVAGGVYGMERPYLSTISNKNIGGATNTAPTNKIATNQHKTVRSGTAQIVNDDLFKRVITWHTYLGDGRQMSIPWIKRRVARFIYGANGSDASINEIQNIGISIPSLPPIGASNSRPTNSMATNIRKSVSTQAK